MLSLRIALRYLFTKKGHNAVNIISIVSMVGVGVATAAIVCVLSVFNGFSQLSQQQFSKVSPDLRVLPSTGKYISNADSLAQILRRVPGVDAAVEYVGEKGLAVYCSRQLPVDVMAYGDGVSSIIDFDKILTEGDMADSVAMADDAVYACAQVSPGVAGRLGIFLDKFEWLVMYAPKRVGKISLANAANSFIADSLIVSGLFETRNVQIDNYSMILPLAVARHLFELTDEATSLELKVSGNVEQVRRAVAERIGKGYIIKTRLEQHEESFRMIEIEKWITFAMLAFILLIASFNVISTLSMIILEKHDSIFTFSALGTSRSMIKRIFLLEGWLITLSGTVIGIVLGVAASLAQQYGKFIKLNGDPSQLNIVAYPVKLEVTDLVVILLLTTIVGLIVGYISSLFVRIHK